MNAATQPTTPNKMDDSILANHYSLFLFPFVHTLSSAEMATRLEQIQDRWQPWWSRLADGDDLASALDDTYFFQPYVRSVLYPETSRLAGHLKDADYERWGKMIREWSAAGTAAFYRHAGEVDSDGSGGMMRLTMSEAALQTWRRIEIGDSKSSAVALPVQIDWIDAFVFADGVGFLAMKVKVDVVEPTISQLLTLNRQFRMVRTPTLNWQKPFVHFLDNEASTSVQQFIDRLVDDFANDATGGLAVPYTATDMGESYTERAHLMTYACADLQTGDSSAVGSFKNGSQCLLYELAAGASFGESISSADMMPHPDEVSRLDRDFGVHVWKCWDAWCLKDTIAVLAGQPIPFNLRALPHNIESDYLPLYVYALHQHYRLQWFADNLVRGVGSLKASIRPVRKTIDLFFDFRNRYWFAEVTRKPLGQELLRRIASALQLKELLQLVGSEIGNVEKYAEERWKRQMQWLGVVFSFLAIISAVNSYISVHRSLGTELTATHILLIFLWVPVAVLAVWRWLARD